jgi:divalent metal cation (Fe/Co/Zn/Cd) transporter
MQATLTASKAEYFSAVLEGVLIVLAALAILREAHFGYLKSPAPRCAGYRTRGERLRERASTVLGAGS